MRKQTLTKVAALLAMSLAFLVVLHLSRLIYSSAPPDVDDAYVIETDSASPDNAEAEVDFMQELASADPLQGAGVFGKCAACHGLEPGVHGVGPSLYNVVGRDVAGVAGYPYSDALRALGGRWTEEALNSYLEFPSAYAPGTTMGFPGLRKVSDRADLIVFLALVPEPTAAPDPAGPDDGPDVPPDMTDPKDLLAALKLERRSILDRAYPLVDPDEWPEELRKEFEDLLAREYNLQPQPTQPQPQPTQPDPPPPPQDTVARLMQDQLKAADLAFNRPETMRLGQATSVELVVSPRTAKRTPLPEEGASVEEQAESLGLSADLSGATQVVEDVDYAMQMEATILGLGFNIDPPGPQRQTVLPDRPAKWVWTIEPKTAGGDQVFTVEVDAIVQRDSKDLPPVRIRTFTERITVDVTPWQRVLQSAKELTAVNAAIVGVGGTLIAVLGWVWTRLRKKKPKEPAKPQEFVVTHKIADGD
ncbi:cytochrome c family protein [uncultured Tateyamaria sp.]|uniref:c-type cytochrome n=1 Tax=uncultured Tateyamaria sp. TaxID=455651 RepID=UPI00262DC190|nr:cytochrome c family protein [uncultured Tateyamaria sp.]